MKNPLKAALAKALDRRTAELREQIHLLQADVSGLSEQSSVLQADVSGLSEQSSEHQFRTEVALRYLISDEAENGRRVAAMRDAADYQLPYEDPDPLVSICVPLTRERVDLFLGRALPSALAQSHQAIEVVVVCDGFDPRADSRLQTIDDPRVRFGWLTQSLINPDQRRNWMSAATLSHGEARRMSRGLWVTELDDDDALPLDAVETLLAGARETRAEITCGKIEQHHPDGSSTMIAGFPPELIPDWVGLSPDSKIRASSAALAHHALNGIARQRTEDFFGLPGDLLLLTKMVRAGVRFAAIDQVVYDYYPGTLWVDS